MTILNLMLGRKRGGLEQAAIDYAEALAFANIPALTIISPHAWIETPLVAMGLAHQSLPNLGYWDMIAAYRLRGIAHEVNAKAIICHGNRAIGLALRALRGRIPVIAVAHNYATGRFIHADHCFAITEHLSHHLRDGGVQTISLMPNMVRLPPSPITRPYRTPPVIGSMGRFVAKKGFDVYIHALAQLKQRGIAFHALLGGSGEEESQLRALIDRLELSQHIDMVGWVKDKAEFFEQIDLFALPSLHEAFGIALIEAMAYGIPVVAADAEGPREIIQHGVNGIIVPRYNETALADGLERLLLHEAEAHAFAIMARNNVAERYSIAAMAFRLQQALLPYITTL
jgi:glycosyltransferase involved in cell wall biosynthesis